MTTSRRKSGGKIQYTIEPLDVDGDGKDDGNLVTKWRDGKVVARKFVPFEKLKALAQKEMMKGEPPALQKTGKKTNTTTQSPIAFRARIPENVEKVDKPLIVQNRSSFAEYIKAGAGVSLGVHAVNGILGAVSEMF